MHWVVLLSQLRRKDGHSCGTATCCSDDDELCVKLPGHFWVVQQHCMRQACTTQAQDK
jgi:hypothetical protein